MKKIFIIIDNITNRAGTERAVTNLSNILVQLNYDVTIVSVKSKEGNCPYELSSSTKLVHLGKNYRNKLNSGIFFSRVIYRLYFFNSVLLYLLRHKIDYVIGTDFLFNQIIAFLPKKIKKIGCEHFNFEIYNKKDISLIQFLYKKLDAVVLLTYRDSKNYHFLKNLYVIPNSLSFIPSKLSDCKNKKMISLGRFTFQKGFDLLIDTINLIKDHLNGWIVELYGYGEDKESLQNKVLQNNLDKIIYVKENTKDVESIYNSASIYLSSSRYEGFGMVLLESQSCGLPAVSFDCPCGPSDIIIEGKTGFLVPLGDVKKMSEKILELINNEELRIKMGNQAAIESRRFSTEKISEMWKNLLEKI